MKNRRRLQCHVAVDRFASLRLPRLIAVCTERITCFWRAVNRRSSTRGHFLCVIEHDTCLAVTLSAVYLVLVTSNYLALTSSDLYLAKVLCVIPVSPRPKHRAFAHLIFFIENRDTPILGLLKRTFRGFSTKTTRMLRKPRESSVCGFFAKVKNLRQKMFRFYEAEFQAKLPVSCGVV